MEQTILNEAFKALDILDEAVFPVTPGGEERLKNFIDGDKIDDIETIIDIDADDYGDLKPSYIGNVILNCPICQSKIYKEPKDIIIDEETNLVNIEEECPYCHTNNGFEIVGEVAEYKHHKEEVEETEEEEEIVEEACSRRKKFLKEEDENSVVSKLQKFLKDFIGPDDNMGHYPARSAGWILDSGDFDKWNLGLSDIADIAEKLGYKVSKTEMGYYGDSDYIIGDEDWYYKNLDDMEDLQESKTLKETPDLGRDLEKYQDWVDYDMKRYHKISDITKTELDKAGLEVVKDAHGDYEVISKDKKALGEAKDTKLPVATYLRKHMKEIYQSDPSTARDSVVKILEDGKKEAEDEDKDQFDKEIRNLKNVSTRAIWSTIGTLLTGIKAGLTESIDEVEVKTDGQKVKVSADEDATHIDIDHNEDEPFDNEEEFIIPVSDEVKDEIEDDSEEDEEEEAVDEFDEESFDELEESHLKKLYENVKSYKTTSCSVTPKSKIRLEGLITFNSGKEKKTTFTFESCFKTKNGKLKYLGENKNLSTNKRAFSLTCSVKNKKLMVESFTYNYTAKDTASGTSRRVYGTIRK